MIASIGHEYRMAGEFDSCVKTFDHAVAMKDGGEVRTERALCKLGLKDDKGTLADLQAAVDKEPTYAPAHYYLGGRLAMSKHFKEAAAEYGKYLELAPDGSLAEARGRTDEDGAGREQEEVGVRRRIRGAPGRGRRLELAHGDEHARRRRATRRARRGERRLDVRRRARRGRGARRARRPR